MTTLYVYRFPSVAVKTSKMVIVRTLKADKADLFLVVCSFHCNIDLLVTYLIVAWVVNTSDTILSEINIYINTFATQKDFPFY